jgi:hypothetical protein
MSSQRKIQANRRNARKSTGPRTAEGKARSSGNSRNHFCNQLPLVPGECDVTYYQIKAEFEEEFRPRTPLQQSLFDQIVDCKWRLMRINDIERQLLLNESRRMEEETGEPAPPCTVMAHLMEKGQRNALASLWRYQMQLQSMQLKLIKQYWWQKKHHPLVGYEREEIEALQDVRRRSERWEAARQAELDQTERFLREQEEATWAAERARQAQPDEAADDVETRANEPTVHSNRNGVPARNEVNEATVPGSTGRGGPRPVAPRLADLETRANEPIVHLNGNGAAAQNGANEPLSASAPPLLRQAVAGRRRDGRR